MIRQASLSDIPNLRSCAERAFARYVPLIGRRPAPMDADFTAQIAKDQVHVSVAAQGAFQGYVVFFPVGGHMHLESVAVLPGAAGKGVGRSLIAFCEECARAQGIGAVHVYTNEKMEGNLTLYPRLGYTETERREEDGFHRVYFEKHLG